MPYSCRVNWIEAIILGLVQGLTEFLPVSSSAHLRIVGEFLPGGGDPGAAFTAITQLGTETAVIIFFWRDIVRIIKHWALSLTGRMDRRDPDARMGWFIIVGSLPIVVLGIALKDLIEQDFRSLWIVRINAAARLHGLSYSRFMNGLLKANVTLDRKALADIAIHDPAAFGAIAEQAKRALAA